MLTFSLQSGSNGNATYVEAGDVRLLFDAGLSGRQVRLRMAEHQRKVVELDAVILSHRHADHTRGAGVLQRTFKLPIYATPATFHAIARQVGQIADAHVFHPGGVLEFGSVTVHTLPTPHDAAESVAFVVEHEDQRLGILTDLGHPFRALAQTLDELDAVYLESNYDPTMLATGSYPPELQARIRGANGHLSNDEAAALLKGCRRRLRWVMLAHLSAQNNDPDLALHTHRGELGRGYPLGVASRYCASELMQV